jgi:hypothetical protein
MLTDDQIRQWASLATYDRERNLPVSAVEQIREMALELMARRVLASSEEVAYRMTQLATKLGR